MLHQLLKYAEDRGLEVEPGFEPKTARWAVVCDEAGRFLDVVPLGGTSDEEEPGQEFAKCPALSQSELVKRGETKTHFLMESARVVALYGEGADQPEVKKKHDYFASLLRQASQAMPELAKLADTLTNGEVLKAIRKRMESCKVKQADSVTFSFGGKFLVDSTAWHEWWRSYWRMLRSAAAKELLPMRCMATGELTTPTPTHLKIKRLRDVGGLPTGDVLIGFDKDAFRSYSLHQSANAAVSEEAMCKYRAALNELLRQRSHPTLLAGAKIVYWFKKKVAPEDDPFAWLQEAEGPPRSHPHPQTRRTTRQLLLRPHAFRFRRTRHGP
jgi:CRISPR-associated protein Csd1